MDAASIGSGLKWARRRAGMTQHDLARATGRSQPSIARIEAGSVLPRTSTLIELLAATGYELALEPIGPAVQRQVLQRRLAMRIPQRGRAAVGPAAKDPATNPLRILRPLRRLGVPFVLIGDLAEAAYGAPVDGVNVIEICHASTDIAAQRLATARDELGLQADPSRLRLVAATESGDDYELLERNAVSMFVDAGIRVRVAALEDLIRNRRARATAADQKAAAMLRAIRATSMTDRS